MVLWWAQKLTFGLLWCCMLWRTGPLWLRVFYTPSTDPCQVSLVAVPLLHSEKKKHRGREKQELARKARRITYCVMITERESRLTGWKITFRSSENIPDKIHWLLQSWFADQQNGKTGISGF